VTNCILWGDTPDEIYDYGSSTTTVSYSDVEGEQDTLKKRISNFVSRIS
jgi:hypothetical protein